MSSAVVRRATPDDAEAITEVYFESAEIHAVLDPVRNYIPDRDVIIERYRVLEHAPLTLVAEADGQIAGFLDARIDQPVDPMFRSCKFCFVADVAVCASYRGRGVGEQLMRVAEEWAATQGAEFMVLEYHTGNIRAGEFYQRLGYRSASTVAVKQIQYE